MQVQNAQINAGVVFFIALAFSRIHTSSKRVLMVGVGVSVAQQAVGIDAIGYSMVYILDESGIESQEAKMGILAAIGIMGLVLIVMAGRWLDRSGRRPALFASVLGMAASLIAVLLSFVGGGGTTRSERADGVRAYVVPRLLQRGDGTRGVAGPVGGLPDVDPREGDGAGEAKMDMTPLCGACVRKGGRQKKMNMAPVIRYGAALSAGIVSGRARHCRCVVNAPRMLPRT